MSQPVDFATSVQNFVSVILTAITDPAAAVNLFSALANFPQPTTNSTAALQLAQNNLQSGMSDLFRRAAIGGLAQAASFYQPTSYNDAENVRNNVCAVIDAEILVAGDQGQDQTYLALKELRSAVVQDLTTRGASLAPLVSVNLKGSLPALAIAYRLYQDVTRSDQIIAFANPPHPAFMPPSFQVLAS